MTAGLQKMRVVNGIASFLVAVICLVGCSTVQVQHGGTVSGPLDQADALTVVLDYGGGSPEDAAKLEVRLSKCVQEALNEAGLAAKVVPSDEFRRTVFPDMDITSAPRSAKSLASLLKVPQFRHKVDSLRLRYLITVTENTASRYKAAALGVTQTKTTNLTAHIIDVKNPSETGEVSITAESKGAYGLAMFLPIIVPARTESPACKRLGREVVKVISGETESKPAGDAP